MSEIAEAASKNADFLYMLLIIACVFIVAWWSDL